MQYNFWKSSSGGWVTWWKPVETPPSRQMNWEKWERNRDDSLFWISRYCSGIPCRSVQNWVPLVKEVTKYNIRSSSSTVLYAAVPASSCVVFRPSQKWRSKENDDASGELLYVFEHKDRWEGKKAYPKYFLNTYVENDIGVPAIECSVAVFRPFDDTELFYTPNLKSWSTACLFPCRLYITCIFTDALLELFICEIECQLDNVHLMRFPLRHTSEPKRAIFESSMSYCVDFDRWAMGIGYWILNVECWPRLTHQALPFWSKHATPN